MGQPDRRGGVGDHHIAGPADVPAAEYLPAERAVTTNRPVAPGSCRGERGKSPPKDPDLGRRPCFGWRVTTRRAPRSGRHRSMMDRHTQPVARHVHDRPLPAPVRRRRWAHPRARGDHRRSPTATAAAPDGSRGDSSRAHEAARTLTRPRPAAFGARSWSGCSAAEPRSGITINRHRVCGSSAASATNVAGSSGLPILIQT